ncbi:MAG TPA: zf-HC2 domain-containing protein [Jatrophihabitans sp.]|nr:zf-HC2 domain-containing protein [Jatrophihabitans sp.]
MRCDRFREAYSARLDDEPPGAAPDALSEHLRACTDCAGWAESAARITRLARLDVTPVPDLADAITAGIALPSRRVLRRRYLLRAALVLVGLAQLGIGVPAALGDSVGMAMATHATHEAGAWNLAIGVAFLGAAFMPRRAAGLIPLLGTFTVVLAVLSIRDLADGAVTVARLATHLAIVIGLGLLISLDRADRALPPLRPSTGEDRDEKKKSHLRGVA